MRIQSIHRNFRFIHHFCTMSTLRNLILKCCLNVKRISITTMVAIGGNCSLPKKLISLVVFVLMVVLIVSLMFQMKDLMDRPYRTVCEHQNADSKTWKGAIECFERPMRSRPERRGNYWVYFNYVRSERTFRCYESVTYTTHMDYTFFENLEPLLDRWKGPLSVAMYTPGTDFDTTVKSIEYARHCLSPLIATYATFHIYYDSDSVPKEIPPPDVVMSATADCSSVAPWLEESAKKTYRSKRNLTYPVNVGRNVARDAATTHYVLASDVELYPNPGLIFDFLELIRREKETLTKGGYKVFPIPVFEVAAGTNPPVNKTQLQGMLENGTAIPFHKKLCPACHNIPKDKEWMKAEQTPELQVFHVGKREGKFSHWEPIYIGTHDEPYYDERLSWEGMSDKMTQGFVLCSLRYTFHILNNAFLVHKPGIKTISSHRDRRRRILIDQTNRVIKKIIADELKTLYGDHKECEL